MQLKTMFRFEKDETKLYKFPFNANSIKKKRREQQSSLDMEFKKEIYVHCFLRRKGFLSEHDKSIYRFRGYIHLTVTSKTAIIFERIHKLLTSSTEESRRHQIRSYGGNQNR